MDFLCHYFSHIMCRVYAAINNPVDPFIDVATVHTIRIFHGQLTTTSRSPELVIQPK